MAGRLLIGPCRVAYDDSGNYGKDGVAGKGGDDRWDNPAGEHAGQGSDGEGAKRPSSERDPGRSNSPGESGEAEDNWVPLPVAKYGW